MFSGYIEFHIDDTELIKSIIGDKITDIRKSDFPGYHVARFKNVPDSVLDKLTPYWGQFEWILDE
jgi:hypothetical protein